MVKSPLPLPSPLAPRAGKEEAHGVFQQNVLGPDNNAHNLGALIRQNYHTTEQNVVPVPMEDLRDFTSSSKEEFGQFTIGQFFFSGSFWLAIERLVTVGIKDPWFWVSIAFCIGGGTIGFFGFRQLNRRKNRIEKLIAEAKKV